MSVTSGATIWTISCDRPRCANQIAVAAASCSQALIDALAAEKKFCRQFHLCPTHQFQKGHQK